MKNIIARTIAIFLIASCISAQALNFSWPCIKKSVYEHRGTITLATGAIIAIGYLYRYYASLQESKKPMSSSKKTETLNGFPHITASIKFTNDPDVQRLTIEVHDVHHKKLGHAQGISTDRDGAILSTIWLNKAEQDKGYGSALFKLFMHEFKHNLPACKAITWIATPMHSTDKKVDQEKLVRFYLRHGAIIIASNEPGTIKMRYTF